MDDDKNVFMVEISNDDPKGYETAATLNLPATWAEFHDALQKARITDGRNCCIKLIRSWREGISVDLVKNAKNLYELNLFARRLTMLTVEEALSLDGLLKIERLQGTQPLPLPRLINLTFNAHCHVAPDVFDDESLGVFLYEGEMLSGEAMRLLDTIEPDSKYRKRLLAVFGTQHRECIGGVFTNCGYMEPNEDEFKEVYVPGEMAYFDRSGTTVVLEVTKGFFDDPDYDNDKTVILTLPATGNAGRTTIDIAIDAVGASSEKECGFRCVECLIPSLRDLIDDAMDAADSLAPAADIARLLEQKQRVWDEAAMVKYKALLEATECSDLEDAVQLMDGLEQYELLPGVAQTWDYAELVLREKYPDLPAELFQTGQSAEIGRKMLEESHNALTSYGLIRNKSGEPLPYFEREGPDVVRLE